MVLYNQVHRRNRINKVRTSARRKCIAIKLSPERNAMVPLGEELNSEFLNLKDALICNEYY